MWDSTARKQETSFTKYYFRCLAIIYLSCHMLLNGNNHLLKAQEIHDNVHDRLPCTCNWSNLWDLRRFPFRNVDPSHQKKQCTLPESGTTRYKEAVDNALRSDLLPGYTMHKSISAVHIWTLRGRSRYASIHILLFD